MIQEIREHGQCQVVKGKRSVTNKFEVSYPLAGLDLILGELCRWLLTRTGWQEHNFVLRLLKGTSDLEEEL